MAGRRVGVRKPPPKAETLAGEYIAAVAAVRAEIGDAPLFIGGRSMGGRICSLAVGDEFAPLRAAGLVLICYPLHPPGKPERLRVEHFPRLDVPCLFISGTKDAFGTPAELMQWTATIPGAVTHEWMDGKGHDLKGCDDRIAALVAAWISAL